MAGRSGAIVSIALVVLIAGAGWLYPLASFALQGFSLSGMHDEATGFLYFYSLRRLYGVDKLPVAPQRPDPLAPAPGAPVRLDGGRVPTDAAPPAARYLDLACAGAAAGRGSVATRLGKGGGRA